MATEATLRDSPEMKDARTLEAARVAAETAKSDGEKAQREADDAGAALAREEHQRQVAAGKANDAWDRTQDLAGKALEQARAAGLEQRHRDAVERLRLPEADATRADALQRHCATS
jgi:hypothetical protein